MKKEEILKKAIEKAQRNGFDFGIDVKTLPFPDSFWATVSGSFQQYSGIIFSHDFAKAFWGNAKWCWIPGYDEWGELKGSPPEEKLFIMTSWQYHLQQMVISEDPIKYLEKYL